MYCSLVIGLSQSPEVRRLKRSVQLHDFVPSFHMQPDTSIHGTVTHQYVLDDTADTDGPLLAGVLFEIAHIDMFRGLDRSTADSRTCNRYGLAR
jgi:hypothetical protein